MDEKPGCIHPGDPDGCIGGFMTLTVISLLIAIIYAIS